MYKYVWCTALVIHDWTYESSKAGVCLQTCQTFPQCKGIPSTREDCWGQANQYLLLGSSTGKTQTNAANPRVFNMAGHERNRHHAVVRFILRSKTCSTSVGFKGYLFTMGENPPRQTFFSWPFVGKLDDQGTVSPICRIKVLGSKCDKTATVLCNSGHFAAAKVWEEVLVHRGTMVK